MSLSAHDVAAELRRRLPGLGTKKLHKLLYYCQGHHLTVFDEPLFTETISAWDMGPVVEAVCRDERYGEAPVARPLHDEAHLNTVGYVASRYGSLSGAELERLTHGEEPWIEANRHRPPGTNAKIPIESMRSFFRAVGDDDEAPLPDAEAVTGWLQTLRSRPSDDYQLDSIEALRARLAER